MKIIAYNVLPFEEEHFLNAKQSYNLEQLTTIDQPLTMENVNLAKGFDAVNVLAHSQINAEILNTLHDFGIKHLSTRTIGYDHINVETAHSLGISISNAHYPPYNVAEFTVMIMLMLIRKIKVSICRALVNDFSLDGLQGKELRSMTVGIIGTGKIGQSVIEILSGFGCKILAYNKTPISHVETYAEYVDLDTLLKQSDIISLHIPLTEENHHLINKETIKKMKKNVLLINTSRGGLINSEDLIDGLESEWIGGAGLDTLEEETGISHFDIGTRIINKRPLFYLKQFPNVIFTQHYAFFTEEATNAMVRSGLEGLMLGLEGKENPYLIV
ncbi:D-isomer specific 2-hydroxyacid dehydrogenase family protein [Amphibacillus jilinensis]|uniref:D-isomer specific 2-hydroxyacid dehydrogenase family protein n=1 Tax=Amphibacillus jilinensis TaxID=1216008 RepID=UPI0002E8BA71|nr:D-isomer specific 2-hydroxyacid dehydrogenase family protein [Amphibacillus jilinensis]